MAYKNQPTVGDISLPAGPAFSTPSKVMKAGGASAANIKKVQKQEIGKPLSKAMQQWVQANRSKLKQPTKKQKAIFEKYDQMQKAGMLDTKPAKQNNQTTVKQSRVTKPVTGTTPARNTKAKSEAARIASTMKSEVTKRESQKVTDAIKRDVNKRAESRSGTRGAAPQTESKTEQRRRGSSVKRTGKKVNLGKTLQNLSDKFKLTRKAGEVFTVGNMKYVSDGKGGIRSSQRFR